MRGALGQPLTNIPTDVLNQMVSKDVARDMRKFKMNAGANKASKRSKSRGAQDADQDSPMARRSKSNEDRGTGSLVTQIRNQLRDLDRGIAVRNSLLKSQVINCDENDKQLDKAKHALAHH